MQLVFSLLFTYTIRENKEKKMEKSSSSRITNICVFCGSSSGVGQEFVDAAKELGKVMTERKMHLVYGGGNLGLMGAVSKSVQDGGNQVLGIVPKPLADENLIGKTNGEELVVSGMPERLFEMINHADAFIALPGGLGTLEEIFVIASWANLNIHQKPIGLLNVNHFYDFLLAFFENAQRSGFISKPARDIVLTARRPDELIDLLQAYKPRIDPIISKLDWSDNGRGKKRRVDLNLSL